MVAYQNTQVLVWRTVRALYPTITTPTGYSVEKISPSQNIFSWVNFLLLVAIEVFKTIL